MNMLRKLVPLRISSARLVETKSSSNTKKIIIEPLVDRDLVRVSGEDVEGFLQGLVTNDVSQLKKSASSMYALFLNNSGRILYDTFIYRTGDPNTYVLECDKSVTPEFKRHLRLYRVRRKIDVEDLDKEYSPWVAFTPSDSNIDRPSLGGDFLSAADPRLKELGVRVLMNHGRSWVDLAKYFSKPGNVSINLPTTDCNYRLQRYVYGVGEGVIDLPPGKCFALESNCDYLHGVSFQKGCYIGQELTARTHHTGVIRKRLMPIRLTAPVSDKDLPVQLLGGVMAGTLRSHYCNRGLALMRLEHALKDNQFAIDGETCYVEKPHWWPKMQQMKARQ